MLKLKSCSPSRIKTFDMCKFKYWLTYHCPDVKLKSNWGAAHGSLLHDILENLANKEDTDWMSRLYRGYAGELSTLDRNGQPEIMESPLVWAKSKDYQDKKPYCDTCPYKQEERCGISKQALSELTGCPRYLFDISVSMLESTIKRYQGGIWDKMLRDAKGVPIGTEYSFEIKIKGTDVPLIGILDLVIEEDPETIHIIDYKSGAWVQNYAECREDIQVKIYSMASRKEFIEDVNNKGYKYKNVILTFDYFASNPITLAFTADEDAATEVWTANKINEIQNTNWIDRIVRSNDDFTKRWAWKCRSLCDTEVCASKWNGKFKAE
jgi:hypothetical protein